MQNTCFSSAISHFCSPDFSLGQVATTCHQTYSLSVYIELLLLGIGALVVPDPNVQADLRLQGESDMSRTNQSCQQGAD